MTFSDVGRIEPRGISKEFFECLVVLMILVLVAIGGISQVALNAAGHHRWSIGIGILVAASVVAVRSIVDRIFKTLGLSLSGSAVEVQGSLESASGDVNRGGQRFELYKSVNMLSILSARDVACFLACSWVFDSLLNGRLTGVVGLIGISVFFSIVYVFSLLDCLLAGPLLWADDSGIKAPHLGSGRRLRFVPWSSVATCEIETEFDTFGRLVQVRPVLKGIDGAKLLAFNLMEVRLEDQERLAKFLKARFPKTQVDLWD